MTMPQERDAILLVYDKKGKLKKLSKFELTIFSTSLPGLTYFLTKIINGSLNLSTAISSKEVILGGYSLLGFFGCITLVMLRRSVAKDPMIQLVQRAIDHGTSFFSEGYLHINYEQLKIKYQYTNCKLEILLDGDNIIGYDMTNDQRDNIRLLVENELKKIGLRNKGLPEVEQALKNINTDYL